MICIRLAQEKKAAYGEEKSQEVYISRMREATLAGGFQPNLEIVCVSSL